MKKILHSSCIVLLMSLVLACTSCATSKLSVEEGVNLSQYKRVNLSGEFTGHVVLEGLVPAIDELITNTRLIPVSIDEAAHSASQTDILTVEYDMVEKFKQNYSTCTLTVSFYDYLTDKKVTSIQVKGVTVIPALDAESALHKLGKKLTEAFGKKETSKK